MSSSLSDNGLIQKTQALGMALEDVRLWMEKPLLPLPAPRQKALRSAIGDLLPRLKNFEADPTLLTVVFMGGTGVGKSTLLNALAGAKVAEMGLVRPTTQFPTVYHHREVNVDRLDPAFATCRRVPHDRDALRFKVLVDTPDMDGNIIEHRQRLAEILPVADAVLYVGSQEKYHDQEGWKLLLDYRGNHGFAFVLNKWDRCSMHTLERTGRGPDEDFRRSLAEAGFSRPLMFRTCAVQWAGRRLGHGEPDDPIEDQFEQLEAWIERGLHDRMIREIKVRGIATNVSDLRQQLREILPQDFATHANALRSTWKQGLREGLSEQSSRLVELADRHAATLDVHFAQLARAGFRGLFRIYLEVVDRVSRIGFGFAGFSTTPKNLPIESLMTKWLGEGPSQSMTARSVAIRNHLLADADHAGWPLEVLERFLPEGELSLHSHHRSIEILGEEFRQLEGELAQPTARWLSTHRWIRLACNWLPWGVVLFVALRFVWDLVRGEPWGMGMILGCILLVVATLVVLHGVLLQSLPVRWPIVRPRLRDQLSERMLTEFAPAYEKSLDAFLQAVTVERERLLRVIAILEQIEHQLAEESQGIESEAMFAEASAPAPGHV